MSLLRSFVDILFWLLDTAILLRVVFSWLNVNPQNPLVSFVHQITDPILEPLRRVLPAMGPLDLSPFFALLALQVVHRFLLMMLDSFV